MVMVRQIYRSCQNLLLVEYDLPHFITCICIVHEGQMKPVCDLNIKKVSQFRKH